jgi:membrane-bound metal-dependent hydrolase YbcI (DUF457 family)
MHSFTHFITSLLIATLISLRYNVGLFEFLLAILSGTLIDLDHIYNYMRYHRTPKSLKDFIEKILEAYKQPPNKGIRYHTAAHELIGVFVFLLISILVGFLYSTMYALLIFLSILSHFLLDALSIRMMIFSPFSKREFYIGLLKPNSVQEKVCIIILLATTFLILFLKMLTSMNH